MNYGRWTAGADRWRRAPEVATGLGLGLVAAMLMITLGPDRRQAEPLPPPPGPFLPPVSAAAPALSDPPSDRDPAMTGAAAAPTSTRPAPPSQFRPATRPPTTPPPAPDVTGRYRVVDSFDDGFIGEVLVTNTGGRDRDWKVRLRFAGNVTALRTSWVESAPQATLTVSGGTFTWTSGVGVRAGSDVALRFHFSRSGSGDRPRSCTVNGTACTG